MPAPPASRPLKNDAGRRAERSWPSARRLRAVPFRGGACPAQTTQLSAKTAVALRVGSGLCSRRLVPRGDSRSRDHPTGPRLAASGEIRASRRRTPSLAGPGRRRWHDDACSCRPDASPARSLRVLPFARGFRGGRRSPRAGALRDRGGLPTIDAKSCCSRIHLHTLRLDRKFLLPIRILSNRRAFRRSRRQDRRCSPGHDVPGAVGQRPHRARPHLRQAPQAFHPPRCRRSSEDGDESVRH